MFGKNHTDDVKLKLSKFRKGKSYNDIMSMENSNKLREMHRQKFIGENNPNYIDIKKDDLYKLIVVDKKTNRELSQIYKTSDATIISKCKKFFYKTPRELKNENKN